MLPALPGDRPLGFPAGVDILDFSAAIGGLTFTLVQGGTDTTSDLSTAGLRSLATAAARQAAVHWNVIDATTAELQLHLDGAPGNEYTTASVTLAARPGGATVPRNRRNPTLLADACEAAIGAFNLDGGRGRARTAEAPIRPPSHFRECDGRHSRAIFAALMQENMVSSYFHDNHEFFVI